MQNTKSLIVNINIGTISKFLISAFLLLLIFAFTFLYFKLVVDRDFEVTGMIPCDPSTESCFVHECDPEGEVCEGELEEKYFKLIFKNAENTPECNPTFEECLVPTCEIGESGCEIVECSEAYIEDYGECYSEGL